MIAWPTYKLGTLQGTSEWDYLHPFMGIIEWYFLGMFSVGSTASLSNFVVELFWISVIAIVIPWWRWVLALRRSRQLKILSTGLTVLPIIAAVLLRLMMPTLPE
jgi:hypothetical protein